MAAGIGGVGGGIVSGGMSAGPVTDVGDATSGRTQVQTQPFELGSTGGNASIDTTFDSSVGGALLSSHDDDEDPFKKLALLISFVGGLDMGAVIAAATAGGVGTGGLGDGGAGGGGGGGGAGGGGGGGGAGGGGGGGGGGG